MDSVRLLEHIISKSKMQIKDLDYHFIANFPEDEDKAAYSENAETILKLCINAEEKLKIIKEVENETKRELSEQPNMDPACIYNSFHENLSKLTEMTNFDEKIREDSSMIHHKDLLNPQIASVNASKNNDDDDLVALEVHSSYIDPISKKTMTDPVRNIDCNHVYDRYSITEMIKSKNAKKKSIRCPYVGCSNKQPLKLQNLVDAHDVRKEIELRKRRRN